MVQPTATAQHVQDKVMAFLRGREKYTIRIIAYFPHDIPIEKDYTVFAQSIQDAALVAQNLATAEYPKADMVCVSTPGPKSIYSKG